EAQRAWDQVHTEKFMTRKRHLKSFPMSEPEFLIGVMNRKKDWCTIICLVGGGQEINQGEAGPTEWLDAIKNHFHHWDVYHSAQIIQKEYCWGQDLAAKLRTVRSEQREALHLGVSIRSYRAEKLAALVDAVIDGEISIARELYAAVCRDYPLVVTRSLDGARQWLRGKARGTERFGLVAASGAIRLKPEGINVRSDIDAAKWFLNTKEDIRSSYYLEDVATEFDIQGLELDWTGVCWDADFRREGGKWSLYNFKGTEWQDVKNRSRRVYLANAYRVLLTRARQGMVIFVPQGNAKDRTRLPRFYDETFGFFLSCGVEEID
ncbi:MAG TPA: DNA/RNA helicase domain-containing protein, partial [Candidatus Acidoferrum sp.]|nr:DNA/RNA helicase domain-containing protein [Candidatus Acidoferrum sp.]